MSSTGGHKAQFHALRNFCLPPLLNKKKADNGRINIWSAGCANGEEAYSIAMLIRDLVFDDFQRKVYIKGTDISRQALRKARERVYTERAIRGLAPHYLERYFTKQGDRYLLSADIRTMSGQWWILNTSTCPRNLFQWIPCPGGTLFPVVMWTSISPRITTGALEIRPPQTTLRPTEIEAPAKTPSKSLDESLSVARKLADNGETIAAATILDNIIRQNPLHAQAYFMLAMIHNDAGNLDQSSHYLKRVIYLEPENPLAHLHLADVFKAASRKADAVKEYTNVISLLEKRKNLEEEFGDGFTGQAILAAARAHLKMIAANPTGW
ncbi:CheR methyltransferase, SAM binding domain protein [delta proteobacterium NaphS2]|nr:CheR methyltransferase, SAM binding domain protein [delta proteobacterium NaphS2]